MTTPLSRLLISLSATPLIAAPFLLGQSLPAPVAANHDEDIVVLEAVVTTGSNIKRVDQEQVLPVTVFNADQIAARDAATPMDLLIGIPQITNIPANETPTNAVASRGGNAAVALRGIGAENTLVLLNGRRMPFNPISSLPPTSTVNVNTLPTAGVQQIEVLRDGASAVYGSDAVAGVINFITDQIPKGGTASVRFGVTEHGGGMDILGTLNYGTTFAGDRGKWLTTVSAYNRDAIYLSERDTSASANRLDRARAPWNTTGSVYDGRSSTTRWASYRLGADTAAGSIYRFFPVSEGAAPTLNDPSMTFPRSLYEDYNRYTIGQPMSARGSLYSRVEFDLTPSLAAFGEVLGYASKSQTGRQPITLSSSDARVTLSADNPYNPYGSAFYSPDGDGVTKLVGNPQPITVASVLLHEGGPEKIEATDRMYRVLGGFKGTIGTSTWTWETAAMLGGYRITDFATNSVRESLLKQSALRTGADAWNPFGYTFKIENGAVVADQPYTNPPEVRDFYTMNAKRYGHSRIASVDARLSGEVVELWAGPISASFGAEWRWEYKSDNKDPYVGTNPPDSGLDPDNNDILVMSPKWNYDADRTIYSAYAETIVPLAAPKNDVLLVDALELNASVRFERYSDFGETTKPKFGANWKPFPWIMFRGSINEGFRAPDLTAMHQPTSFTVATPPGNRDTVRNGYFTDAGLAADTQVLNRTYSLPNPSLQPEESEGRSVGVVYEVPKVRGLSFTVDYWEIEQKNLILSQTRDAALDRTLLHAYTQQQLASGVDILAIDVGSRQTPDGANTYVGDAYTLRAPVTADDMARFQQTYAVLPQSEWIAPTGVWLGSTTQLINGTGNNFTSGVDYGVHYNLPRTRFGQFRLSSEWSKFIHKSEQESPDDPIDDDIVAMLVPEWKSSTTLQWRRGPWYATVNATYESDIRTNAQTTEATYNALGQPSYVRVVHNNGSVFYYEEGQDQLQINVGLSYRFAHDANPWLRDTTVRLGVNNLLDEEPALIVATEAGTAANITGYSGSTGSSLWVGRAYSITLTREF